MVIWSVDDMIEVNELVEVKDTFPDLLLFGGDGAREKLAFDYRTDPPRIVMLDLTSLDDDAVVEQAPTFSDFLECLPTTGLRFE